MSLKNKIIDDIRARCNARKEVFRSEDELKIIELIEKDCVSSVIYFFEEHDSKYIWHFPQKDPDDIPENYRDVLIRIDWDDEYPSYDVDYFMHLKKDWSKINENYHGYKEIAWRDIEENE